LPLGDKQQNIEGVRDRFPQKSIAVIPTPQFFSVHAREVVCESGFEIILGITADRGKAAVQGDVVQLIDA